jgi:hypothetical protein
MGMSRETEGAACPTLPHLAIGMAIAIQTRHTIEEVNLDNA